MKKAFFDGTTETKIIQPLTVRVPLNHYRELRHIAVDKDLSLAELIRDIVSQFLEDYEKTKN